MWWAMNDLDMLFDEAKGIIEGAGLITPRTRLVLSNTWFSYVDNPREVNIGLGVRIFGTRNRILHSILHEHMHILVFRVKPDAQSKRPFGDPEDWDDEQRFLCWLGSKRGHVSRYALTHPEEDFVETAVFLLEGGLADEDTEDKVQAVIRWFRKVRRVREKQSRR